MAQTLCNKCGTTVAAGVKKCPECGNLLTSRFKLTIGALAVVVAALAIVIGAIFIIVEDDPPTPSGGPMRVDPAPDN